ncbi:hypothetical protein Droror1_Dr00025996 [Drosera rotundifolia]
MKSKGLRPDPANLIAGRSDLMKKNTMNREMAKSGAGSNRRGIRGGEIGMCVFGCTMKIPDSLPFFHISSQPPPPNTPITLSPRPAIATSLVPSPRSPFPFPLLSPFLPRTSSQSSSSPSSCQAAIAASSSDTIVSRQLFRHRR